MQVPTIFYDGYCPFCNAVVRMLGRLDRVGGLRFEPMQSEVGRDAVQRHSRLREVDSAFLIERNENGIERVSVESQLFSRLLQYIPWPGKLLLLPFSMVPKKIGDRIYRVIARNRTRIFGRFESCSVPPADMHR